MPNQNPQDPKPSFASQQLDPLPEMDLQDLIRVMRSLGYMHEDIPGKPYAVRFVSAPYSHTHPDTLSKLVFAHNRGTTVEPFYIRGLIEKFPALTEHSLLGKYQEYLDAGKPTDFGYGI